MDVTDAESVKKAIAEVVGKTGRLDVLINNAGIHDRAPFMEMDKSQFDNVLNVNLSSVFSVSQAAAKAMSETAAQHNKHIFSQFIRSASHHIQLLRVKGRCQHVDPIHGAGACTVQHTGERHRARYFSLTLLKSWQTTKILTHG